LVLLKLILFEENIVGPRIYIPPRAEIVAYIEVYLVLGVRRVSNTECILNRG